MVKLLDFCRFNGIRICNGRLGADYGVGKYTYVGSTGSSVIDYVIVNPLLFKNIRNFTVGEPNILSDHCPVEFSISYKNLDITTNTEEIRTYEQVTKKYTWNKEQLSQYTHSLNEEEDNFSNLSLHLTNSTNPNDIDENILQFANLMSKV